MTCSKVIMTHYFRGNEKREDCAFSVYFNVEGIMYRYTPLLFILRKEVYLCKVILLSYPSSVSLSLSRERERLTNRIQSGQESLIYYMERLREWIKSEGENPGCVINDAFILLLRVLTKSWT